MRPAPPSPAARPDCPIYDVVHTVGDRWVALVLAILASGPRRYGEIVREADAPRPRSLSRTLRGMERDGLIDRRVLTTQPPAVRYSLTDLGHSLNLTIQPLREWATRNIDLIRDARLRFEERSATEDRTPWQR